MSLRIVATEYGPRAHSTLKRLVADAKADDPLSPVTIVVPSNYVGVSVRRSLAREQITSAGIGVTGIDLVTTYRLAELIAAPTLAAQQRRPVSNPVVAAAIRRTLGQGESMFSEVRDHPSTERQLLRVHRELRDLDETQLTVLAQQGTRAGDVVAVHRATASLLADDWYDEFDLFDAATTLVRERPTLIHERGRLLVHLPKVLSAAATQLLTEVSNHIDVIVTVGLTGDAKADSSARLLCRQLGVDLPTHEIVPPSGTRVVSVSDADDEVRTVVRHILEAVLDGSPLERMAVVHGADEPYARLLDEQLDAAGIAHNGTSVQQVGHSAIGRTLQSLLSLGDHQYSRADVMSLLSSAPIRQRHDDSQLTPTTEWERLSRDAGITRGPHEWSARLERVRLDAEVELRSLLDPDDRRVGRARRRTRVSAELEEFVTELIDLTGPAAVPVSWPDKCAWARRMLDRYLGDDRSLWPAVEVEAADKVDAALDRLAGLGAIEESPSLATFRRALDVELESTIGRAGTFGEGVFVGRPGQLAGLDLDRVFVLGLAEGVFPARRRDDSLLPDHERSAVGDALASVAGRVDDDHRDLLSALAAASGERTLYFPRGDLRRSAERVPSRWLLDTATTLSGERVWSENFPNVARHSPWADEVASFVAGIRAAQFPATDQEFEARRLIDLRGEGRQFDLDLASDPLSIRDQAFARGVELVSARRSAQFTRFDGNLTHVGGIDAGQLVVSPTRLEAWADCPHKYFMRHVLGIDAIDDPGESRRISALDRGSVIHDVLDQFVNGELQRGDVPAAGRPWSAEARERLAIIVNEHCDAIESRGLVGKQLFWVRDRRAIINDVMVLLDKDTNRKVPGQVLAAELSFGLGDSAPIEHQLPGGRVVRFRGSADRVERHLDGSLGVIDYKTGSDRGFIGIAKNDGDPLVNGTKLQLPVYALAARREHGSDDPVRAYYWFITAKGKYREIGYEVDEPIMTRFGEVVDTILDGLEAGVFPARPSGDSYQHFVTCEYCDPDHLGTGARRREWERKRVDQSLRAYRELAEPETLLEPSDV